MCGIIGYIGYRDAAPVLVEGLKKLEYRGYDSFGIATLDSKISTYKIKGKISEEKVYEHEMKGHIGIGHTRWATHGEPSDKNAHPHTDCSASIAIVHNGIIENYSTLKKELIEKGHLFRSDTDTEVIPHLIEEVYEGNLFTAVSHAVKELEGSYAILAIARSEARIIAARNRSPLVLGIGDRELLAASDVTPLLDYTEKIVFLEDDDIAELSPKGIEIFHQEEKVERHVDLVQWKKEDIKKGGFQHFMLKEIYEQPGVFYETVRAIPDADIIDMIRKSPGITVTACGSSFHASLIFKYLLEERVKKPVRVDLGSEFKYFTPPVKDLVIGVSQSGETADTIDALKKAKMYNCPTLAITNVQGSTITRIADRTFFMRAGPEIGVAATKSFIAQLAVFLGITNLLVDKSLNEVLQYAHRSIGDVLLMDFTEAVNACKRAQHMFYIGRGQFFPISMEGALKMKEISYIHAEAYAAGELKHGPFALLSGETPVIAICTGGITHGVMMSNIKEVKARGAPVIALGERNDTELADIVDIFIPLPDSPPIVQILTSTVIMQLIAYYTANELNCDIDKPRHLAKSVTVE